MDSFVIMVVKDFLLIAGTVTIGFGIATWLTALLTKNDWMVELIEKEKDTETETEKEKYEKKYEEEFSRLDIHELNRDEKVDFKESFCVDDCPRGKVIMRYNLDEETFEYFTNSRNIPHSYLDVIAKKFIIENDCKSIYKLEVTVDENNGTNGGDDNDDNDDNDESNVESNVESNDESNVESNDESNVESNVESNDESNVESEENDGDDKEEEISVFATFKKTEEAKKTPLIVKVINKYKSVGTIEDFDMNTSQYQTNTGEEKVIKLTFKDYKNMIAKSENNS